MTAAEIIKVIEENRNHYCVYGLRSDDRHFEPGQELPCSRNMIDDLYDCESGEYPLLDGTCATGFGYLWFDGEGEDLETVKKAIELNSSYKCAHMYLIAGFDYEYGDDEGELVIKGAEVVCEL